MKSSFHTDPLKILYFTPCCRSQVETISTFESMLLGDPFDFLSNVPQLLSALPSCSLFRQLYRNTTMRQIFTKIGASEILLFYKFFPDKQVTIHPNKKYDDCSCLRYFITFHLYFILCLILNLGLMRLGKTL